MIRLIELKRKRSFMGRFSIAGYFLPIRNGKYLSQHEVLFLIKNSQKKYLRTTGAGIFKDKNIKGRGIKWEC
ncbi:MAG TPA: hypothetical protein DGO70_03010 [Dialister sp.]|nr:hypothetical protein [Dialister sp.]